jgi:hypothetical protein
VLTRVVCSDANRGELHFGNSGLVQSYGLNGFPTQ